MNKLIISILKFNATAQKAHAHWIEAEKKKNNGLQLILIESFHFETIKRNWNSDKRIKETNQFSLELVQLPGKV